MDFSLSQQLDLISQKTRANVNMEDVWGLASIIPALKLRRDQYFHNSDYCSFAKVNGRQPTCSENKTKSIKFARKRKSSYWGTCPFGVWDFAHPVFKNDELICIFYLGGFRSDKELSPINKKIFDSGLIDVISENKKKELVRFGQYLEELINLIVFDWEGQGNFFTKQKSKNNYKELVLGYIEKNYHKNISLEEIAGYLGVHSNYLSSMMKGLLGRNLRQYLLEYRVEKAKVMLLSTKYNITEIAYSCGFQDGNYFSTSFKKITKQSPRTFIKNNVNAGESS